MCGRFMLDSEITDIIESFTVENSLVQGFSSGEVCPSNYSPVIIDNEKRTLISAKWGFKTNADKKLIINARSETVFERSMFKSAMQSRRCIIPASFFYEWKQKQSGSKVKYEIGSSDSKILALGGIYNIELTENQNRIINFVILTTEANGLMSEVHHRMPVIIKKDYMDLWMGNAYTLKNLSEIIKSTKEVNLHIREVRSNNKAEQMSMF